MPEIEWCACCGSEMDSDNNSGAKCKGCGVLICDNCRGAICEACEGTEEQTIDEAFMSADKGPTKAEMAENDVLDWLIEKRSAATPTVIGQRVGGKDKNKASSWACKVCVRLIAKGLVAKTSGGQYYALR